MFFAFGWGRATNDDLGPTYLNTCQNCSNESVWHLVTHKRWFSFFFVPVFPYQTTHLLLCPICTRGFELEGEQLEHAKRLNLALRDYNEGAISQTQFQAALSPGIEASAVCTPEADDLAQDGTALVARCPQCRFKSYNTVCTTCPDCHLPLISHQVQ